MEAKETETLAPSVDSLLRAVQSGSVARVEALLAAGADVNATDKNGFTVLHTAAQSGDVCIMALLVERGAGVHARAKNLAQPIHLASWSDQSAAVAFLLDHDAEIEAADIDGWTPLHLACYKGDVRTMALLMERGADVHNVTKNGATTLYLSVEEGRTEAVEYLLDQGVAVDVSTEDGFTAFHAAAEIGDVRIMTLLMECGADIHATAKNLVQPIHRAALSDQSTAVAFLLDHDAQIEAVDSLGFTPLHFACSHGDVRTMALLVERGADVHKVTNNGRTTLYLSAYEGKLEAVEYLLDHGVAVDLPTKDNFSVLHTAAARGDVRIMTLLVERGADVHAKSKNGELPVHVAARKGNMDAVKYLLHLGAPANATNDDGSSALHLAAMTGDVRTMALLIEHGADIHTVTKSGRSTLHASALKGNSYAVRFLIKRGVALKATNLDGFNALHFAAGSGDVETITLLVDLGLDVHALTKYGHSALLLAASKGKAEAVKYLLECGVSQSADSIGWTPLFAAADAGDVHTMQYLVEYGADVHCKAKSGHNIIHQAVYQGRLRALPYILCLRVDVNAIAEQNDGDWRTALMLAIWHPDLETASEMAFLLCSRGAEWNEEHRRQAIHVGKVNDEAHHVSIAEHERRRSQREGLCVCVRHWSQEQLTTRVPVEVIARGAASVETYLADIDASGAGGLTYRCKSCVVGPSEWGKTSLVRTLVTKQLSLTQLKDRTVGIDLVPCMFSANDRGGNDAATAQLEMTFWDFAGQTVYHVAHGPFFSRRTLYVVVVDVDVYAKQLQDSQDKPQKLAEAVMNRFISAHMLRWIRMIRAHQSDARFIFVGTKADLVKDEGLVEGVQKDVQDRWEAWERNRYGGRRDGQEPTDPYSSSFRWLTVNNKLPQSIAAARQFLQENVFSFGVAFPMGNMYSSVLRSVKARRQDVLSAKNGLGRIEGSLVLFTKLRRELQHEIDGLKFEECEQILRTLHDLGDILWYEHDDAGVLKDYIILDPMLVIDVVREVIRHDFDAKTGVEWPHDGRIAHDLLCTFALWKDVDKEMMHAFKKLLQHFELAYPAHEDVMRPESDLIVPTYWKVDRSKSSRNLLSQKSVCDAYSDHRWCWEYEVPNESAEMVFDKFAVQSYAAQSNRKIRGGCIEAKCDEYATSIKLIQQNCNSDVVRIEVSGTTMERSWHLMRYYLMTMEKLLAGYNGISVGRYIIHRASPEIKDDIRCPIERVTHAVRIAVARGESESSVRSSMPWMPPDMMWLVDKLWEKDIHKFQQLKMQSLIEDKLEVLRKLTIAGSEPRFPALWSLERLPEENKVVVRVLSDLSGVCFHAPMEFESGSPLLTQYGSFFKAGLSIASTVAAEALSVPLVDKAVDAIKTSVSIQVDHAVQLHNLIERLNIKTSTTTPSPIASPSETATTFESRTAKLPPGVAKAVLQDLLKLSNDSSDELNISQLTNLECVVTEKGEYVWAHEHEVAMLGDKVTRCDAPPSVWADLPEPSPAPNTSSSISPSPSPTNKISSRFKLSLCVDSVTGLTDWDWYKTYCTWQLFYGETSRTTIASGATIQNTDSTSSPSWRTTKTIIESVRSAEMLRECRLMIQVKRRSRIGWTKLIGEGELSLHVQVNLSPNQTWQSDAIQVPLEKAAPATRFVTIQLARET